MSRYGTIALLWVLAAAGLNFAVGQEATAPTSALTPDPQHGMVLFLKRCAACHGRHAWGDGPREIPALAGQGEKYVTQQLERFISGQRPGSDMHGPAMRESAQLPDVNRAQAIRDLASYLAQAARNPRPEYGQAQTLAAGQRFYEGACKSCHGDRGAGNDDQRIPAIGGQHYSYLASRLRDFASGHMAHPRGLAAISAPEQQALADYVSRLSYLSAPPDR
ncbi:MAG TPA: c-type cytochrome [Steroidobacteraceae bacterium]|nr:c-type cytochrome [Steroidobacteraceae bacterium]